MAGASLGVVPSPAGATITRSFAYTMARFLNPVPIDELGKTRGATVDELYWHQGVSRTSARASLSSWRASCFLVTSPPSLPPAAAIRALADSGFPSARTDGARKLTSQAATLALGRAVSVRSPSPRPLGCALGAPNAREVRSAGDSFPGGCHLRPDSVIDWRWRRFAFLCDLCLLFVSGRFGPSCCGRV